MRSLLSTIRSVNQQVLIAYFALAAVILVIVTGAVLGGHAFVRANTIPIGEVRSGYHFVDGRGAQTVNVQIIPAMGEMILRGGAQELAELDFTTNLIEDPQVVYSVDDGVGDLVIEAANMQGIPDTRRLSGYRHEWDLRLNSQTPLDLEVTLGAGEGHLDLKGMTLTGLKIAVGAGEALVDLRGDWEQSFHTEIATGAGKVTLLLPDDVGVRVEVARAIGDASFSGLEKVDDAYVNSAYDGTGVILDIEVAVAVGEANLVVLDEAVEWVDDEEDSYDEETQ